MKKWIVRILLAVLVIGAFAAVGFAGYRLGYVQGAQTTRIDKDIPPMAQFERGRPEMMPGFGNHFERGFDREFQQGGFVMRHRGGFDFFPPFTALARIAILGLVIWIVYMLFKGNGWQLSLTRVAAPQTPPAANPVEASAPKKTGKGKQ